jgi:hypothetical protein
MLSRKECERTHEEGAFATDEARIFTDEGRQAKKSLLQRDSDAGVNGTKRRYDNAGDIWVKMVCWIVN